MGFVAALVHSELKKSFYNSRLQMFLLALIVYSVTCFAGPAIACGAGNTDIDYKVFQCAAGEMQPVHKLVLLVGLAFASLCAGRAASLFSKR